jgi:hypothetical protein
MSQKRKKKNEHMVRILNMDENLTGVKVDEMGRACSTNGGD